MANDTVLVSPATAIVQADHLSKWYGQVSGLNDVTVAIPPGITGLLGPNGAGKSTFMKLMTGLNARDVSIHPLEIMIPWLE